MLMKKKQKRKLKNYLNESVQLTLTLGEEIMELKYFPFKEHDFILDKLCRLLNMKLSAIKRKIEQASVDG